MKSATFQIPIVVTVTAQEKKRIAKFAKDAGIPMGAFIRRAALAYCTTEEEEEAMLEKMIDLMNKSTDRANAAIDNTLAFVEASNQRIAEMDKVAATD